MSSVANIYSCFELERLCYYPNKIANFEIYRTTKNTLQKHTGKQTNFPTETYREHERSVSHFIFINNLYDCYGSLYLPRARIVGIRCQSCALSAQRFLNYYNSVENLNCFLVDTNLQKIKKTSRIFGADNLLTHLLYDGVLLCTR